MTIKSMAVATMFVLSVGMSASPAFAREHRRTVVVGPRVVAHRIVSGPRIVVRRAHRHVRRHAHVRLLPPPPPVLRHLPVPPPFRR